jgi:aminopeptidase N
MLRGLIGTDKFWAGIREYYRRFRDSTASTEDLRRVMEETSGTDLGWFFQQWLLRPGSPIVSGGWKYNATAKKIEIDLEQSQSGAAYRLPIEVAFTLPGAPPEIQRIEFTAKSQKFELAADKEPSSVELDPNVWVLMESKITRK